MGFSTPFSGILQSGVRALLAIDGSSCTLDGVFETHVAPIRHWAAARWDNWFAGDHTQDTLDAARRKLACAKGS